MSRIVLLLYILFQGLCVMAQSPWIDDNYRAQKFPQDIYYVSYHSLLDDRNKADDCVARTISEVQAMLANSIFSEISSISQSVVTANNVNGNYNESESFYNEFSTAASAKLVNTNIEHYYDPKNHTAHAIAYVKKKDLTQFCETKLTTLQSALESKFQSVENLKESGHKKEAKIVVAEALESINSYPPYLSQLIAIGNSTLNTEEISRNFELLSKNFLQLKADLERAVAVYFNATHSSMFVKPEIVSSKCRGILSDKGCNFVNESENADFVVDIEYSTRTSSNSDLGWFAYSDVHLTIKRTRDGIIMYDDVLSVKGGGGTEERAHRKAIELSPKLISEKIINCINE